MTDNVNQPAHYIEGRAYQVINVIEDNIQFATDPVLGFLQGQVLKYLMRMWSKDSAQPLEHAEKAQWYLNRMVTIMQDESKANGEIPSNVLFGSDEDFVPFDGTEDLSYMAYEDSFKKDLTKFQSDEVVWTYRDGNHMLGQKRDGSTTILGTYDEILNADPRDLAPSEFEPLSDT
jgi:hypothetical protein|tara:strand:+ start:3703 stop:4227 length:525 start_codon:yes stop_codon:yes gene_type:complete